MKKIIPFLLVFVLFQSRAQNILLNFSGSGAATAIDSVRIQNLKQCASVKILGNDTLKLSNPTLLKSLIENNYKKLHVFPNPTEQNSVFEFDSPESGPVFIDIFNAAGKRIHRSEFE